MARFQRDDIEKFHELDLYLPTRTMFMGSVVSDEGEEWGVDAQLSSIMIKNLHVLEHLAPAGDKPINIIINNFGGDDLHGMSIYDAIKSCKNFVNITVMGHCMSIAAWILQAGDKRIMTPNSRLMVHTGTLQIPEHHPQIAIRVIDNWKRNEQVYEQILLEKIKVNHPKFTLNKVKDLMRFDTYLSPEEALDYNLIDEIA